MSILTMVGTLDGSILIPSYDITCPRSFPYFIVKLDFLGLRETPNDLHL